MKIIAVDTTSPLEPIPSITRQIKEHKPEGWRPVFFDSASDLMNQLKDLKLSKGDTIDEIEIVSEGSPTFIDHVQVPYNGTQHAGDIDPADFGARLAKLGGFVPEKTVVFLSGCNTGLASRDVKIQHCTAQTVADASGAIVRGAAGYIYGLHATNDEAVSEFNENGEHYQHARDATGSRCWNEFRRKKGITP